MSGLSRAARLVSGATLVSRVLGLLRDAVRAALLGKGRLSDVVDVAFKVPNLLRDLFAEGAFSGAFVPTIARAKERGGTVAALEVFNRVASTLLVYVGAIVALGIAFAPAIVRVIAAPEYVERADAFASTVLLVRLLAPFLLLVSLAVAAMGTLNVCGRFFLPALSPASQNLLLVVGGVALYLLAFVGEAAAVPWAVLLLLGGLVQFAVQVPALRAEGWRPRFAPDLRLRTPEAREIVRRMLPVVGGLAATHVSILINTRLATVHDGGQSNLYYAFRLVHLPVGLVGVAFGTAVLAEASRRAARGDDAGVGHTLREALLLSLALSAPAAAGLFVLGDPLARMLFQWGATDGAGAAEIGATIRWFSPAVVFYCAVKVVAPVFYAQGRMRVPLLASLVAVAANVAAAVALHPQLRWHGLALAVGIGQTANLAVLLLSARREFGPAPFRLAVLGRILAATAACAGAAALALAVLPEGAGAGARLARGLVPVVAGAAAYAAAGRLLGSREILVLLRAGRLDRGDGEA